MKQRFCQPLQEKSCLLQATSWNLPRFGGRILLVPVSLAKPYAMTRAMNVPALGPDRVEDTSRQRCLISETGSVKSQPKLGVKKVLRPTINRCHTNETNCRENFSFVRLKMDAPGHAGVPWQGEPPPLPLFRNPLQHTFRIAYPF